jgi:holo-[acyl-carrier protein] synthase
MRVHGIGVDMVRISRVEASLLRFGVRFAERILSAAELSSFHQTSRKAALLSKHFAAKEALVKALGTGFTHGVSWRHIEVHRDPLGKPYLVCRERALELLRARAVAELHLSLCDEDAYALAFVVLLKE